MTDRYNSVLVVFDRDIRTDDAESLLNAIRMIKGVIDVKPNVANISDCIAETRVKDELLSKIYEVLKR